MYDGAKSHYKVLFTLNQLPKNLSITFLLCYMQDFRILTVDIWI